MPNPTQKPPVLTRKHLVGLERERFFNRLLLIGTAIVVAIVLVLVSWSWVLTTFVQPGQTVAVVEGTQLKGKDFIARAKLYRAQLVSNYLSVFQEYSYMVSLFGSDPTTRGQIDQQYSNQLYTLQYQLLPEVVGQLAINELVDDELLKREAAEMGITVSEEQLTERVQNLFEYFPNGTPTSQPEITAAPTSTLSAAQYAIVSATPTASETPTPSVTPTLAEEATSTPTLEPTVVGTATLTSTPSPTATPYTLEGFQTAFVDYSEAVGVTEDDFRAAIYSSLLREAVKDAITVDLPRTQEQVWARQILVGTVEEAEAVLARLDEGEDWNALAAELSLDTSNKDLGGDLGWFPREQMVEPFANAAFELRIGEISQPVQSDFGWHIIQVIGHEDRPLSSDQYEQVRQQALSDFIQTLREKYSWELYENWKAMAPDQPDIPAQAQLQPQQQQ
ncbi:MAG: peptidylprolyl isomerase [Chloroflexi bacterium]|nr:peptidylprolyl isomerase [Chloroflexota bacterium]